MPKPTTLVTGAAGFVGSRLARQLLDRGDRVVGLDNLNDYYSIELKKLHLKDLEGSNFVFEKLDLRDAPAISKLFETHKIDRVAHLAAMAAVRYSAQHPLIYGEVNVQGSMNLLDAARHHGNVPCVLASTGSVYGADTPVPFSESAPAVMPLAPYPASKRAMELFAHAFHHLYKTPITILRFFNVYGPHGRPDMMPWQWTQQIINDEPLTLYGAGKLKRDWTYIDDIVSGFVTAIEKPFPFEILNLGCGNPVENLDFVKVLEDILGKKAKIIDTPTPASEPLITFADVTKSRKMLGYEPKWRVNEGLKKFVDWLKKEKLVEGLR